MPERLKSSAEMRSRPCRLSLCGDVTTSRCSETNPRGNTESLVYDMNVLYDAYLASMKGSAWKEEPQRFEIDFLSEITKLKHELESRTYKTSDGSTFILHERGKVRCIHGSRMRDRVVRHAFCDTVLTPKLKPYLIHNNGASQKDKGISFARREFEKDLHNFYLEYSHNNGYAAFVDMSKFYDNIQHEKVKESINPKIDEYDQWLLAEILHEFEVDVSYMSDEEYARCMDEKFDSIRYFFEVPKRLHTGEKMMRKSVDIGDQVSQDIGVFFPTPIDNYVKIVRGVKRYGRYMDDMYIIAETREELISIIEGIYAQARALGLFVNEQKTRIVKLSDTFKFLQIRYRLTDTGKVSRRITQKSMTRERRKLKAYKRLLDKGEMPYADIENAFRSWFGNFYRYMSMRQIANLSELYQDLFKEVPTWRNHSKLRWLMEHSSRISN